MEGNPELSAGASVTTEQNVNPWSVTGAVGEDGVVQPINYNKLVDQFGTKPITEALLERFERVTGHKPHRFLRRQIVFSHRDLEVILDRCSTVLIANACLH
jgi:tryptophanyl-tRNA synthetase